MFKLKIIDKPEMFKMKCNFEFPKIPIENLQEKEVNPTTEKQEIVADKEYSALSKVMINAVTSDIDSNIQSYNIKKDVSILGVTGNVIELNGEERATTPTKGTQIITPSADKNAITKMTVNPIPDEYIIPSGEIEITSNGNYNVTDKVSAKVNVPEKQLGAKTITKNGVYNATDDNLDGYSQVEVETSGVDINDYFNSTKKNTGSFMSYVKRVPTTIDFSGYTDFGSVFANCSGLEEIPLIDTSKATYMGSMFYKCSSLKTIPLIDTSKVTNAQSMFSNCSSLKTIPLINTSKTTNMNNMFIDCSKLEEIPLLDTSNVTSAFSMFQRCSALITIPQLDTSKITEARQIFAQCTSLTTVPLLNCSSVMWVSNIFQSCQKLENLGGLYNLGNNYSTSISANDFDRKLNLFDSRNLTHDSLMNVINNLYDIAAKGVKTQKLEIGSTNLAKLTTEEIAIATNKGWTVS